MVLFPVGNNTAKNFQCTMKRQDEYIEQQIANLGRRIKTLRKAKGHKNYEYFAYENEINRAQYGRYENGVDMRFSSILRVLKALDISLVEFFSEGFEEKPPG